MKLCLWWEMTVVCWMIRYAIRRVGKGYSLIDMRTKTLISWHKTFAEATKARDELRRKPVRNEN